MPWALLWGEGWLLPTPQCQQTLLACRDPAVSQAKGQPAPAELGSDVSVMPSWGQQALGSCQLPHRHSDSQQGLTLSSPMWQGCLCLLDLCCPKCSPIPVGDHWHQLPRSPSLGHLCPQCLHELLPAGVPHSTGVYSVPQLLPGAVDGVAGPTISLGLQGGCPCSGGNAQCCWSLACVPVLLLLEAPTLVLLAHLPAPGAHRPVRVQGLVL